jgi:hypothetical protein
MAVKPITDAERITLERILKRKLSAQEIATRSLSREPAKPTPIPTHGVTDQEFIDLVMNQPLRNEFKPIVKNPNDENPFAEVLAEAEAAAEAERIESLPPAQRHLIAVRSAAAEMVKRNAETAAMAQHLAANAKTLTALRALIEETALDPYYSFEDVQAIRDAIAQIEFGPTADETATATLIGNVDAIKGARLGSRIEDISARMRDAGLDEGEIAAMIAKRFAPIKPAADETPATEAEPEAVPKAAPNTDPALVALRATASASYKEWNALVKDPKADPSKTRDALSAWSKADQTARAYKAPVDETPAPKPAESGAAA